MNNQSPFIIPKKTTRGTITCFRYRNYIKHFAHVYVVQKGGKNELKTGRGAALEDLHEQNGYGI